MGIFDEDKKKSESFKPLSEVEIQKKLYGTLRPPHLFDQQNTSNASQVNGAKSSSIPEKSSATDLFVSPLSLPAEKTNSSAAIDKKNMKQNAAGGINKWLDQEAEVLDKNLSATSSLGGNLGASNFKGADSPRGFQKLIASFGATVGQLGAVVIQLIQAFLGGSWKRHVSKLGLVVLVLALIVAIQSLNNQREVAMKKPKTVTAPKIVVTEQNLQNALTPPVALNQEKKVVKETSAVHEASALSAAPASTVEQAATSAAPADIPAAKPYVIQVATYVNLADAQNMLDGIQKAGFPGFIQSMKRQSGRVYHCVFVGRFATYEEGDLALRKFKKIPVASSFPDVFIRKLK